MQSNKLVEIILIGSLLLIGAVGILDAVQRSTAAAPTPTLPPQSEGQITPLATSQPASAGTPQVNSANEVGEVWQGSGVIAAFDATGMTLTLSDAKPIYVELGPSTFWSAQGVTLSVGDSVTVNGFYNGEQYHAALVTKADGAKLQLRDSTSGQPLWAGNSGNQGQNGTPEAHATLPADAWVTLDGRVTAVSSGGLVMSTMDQPNLPLNLGSRNFWQSQGITFTVGDALRVVGYWQNQQFMVGDVTKVATGERLMIRDPNGRPLWAGRNASSGNGNGGNGGQGGGNQQNQPTPIPTPAP